MASLYRRDKSPFLWIKYRDDSGVIRRKSTRYRWEDPVQVRQARKYRAEIEAAEIGLVATHQEPGRFKTWVEPFLGARYSDSPLTLSRYRCIWRTLEMFLEENSIHHPGAVKRDHAYQYVDWRQDIGHQNNHRGKGPKTHINTVCSELQFWGFLMREAVKRQWAVTNPLSDLGIKKSQVRVKAEMTDEHIAIIQEHLAGVEGELGHFLRTSFEIARCQACRLAETRIALDDVDFLNHRVRLTVKGRRTHLAALNPNLIPLLTRIKAEGRTHTWECPVGGIPSLHWWRIFYKLRADHPGKFDAVSFHSLRVTGISRLERAGVPEHVVMSQVRHASTTVHRIYRRVNAAELAPFWHVLGSSGAPENQDSPPATSAPNAPSSGSRE